jgi:hypothetical protein
MPLILGWLRMAGTGWLNGSGLTLIRAAVWIFLLPVTLVSVSMLFETLGVLGVCVVTWRPSNGMLSLTAFIMLPDIFVRLTGMLLASLPLPVRKLGPWLVVPLSLLLLLVVGCLIVLPPCAFGMVALNLARLIMSSSPF